MKIIQMTIDKRLLEDVDQNISELRTSRSAFIREALYQALRRFRLHNWKPAADYIRHPVAANQFDGWQDAQVWGTSDVAQVMRRW